MSNSPVRLLIHGANGRMGQALQRLCDDTTGCRVVAAVSRKVGPRVLDGIPQFAASELAGVPEFDVAIDFSLPEGFDAILGLCLARGKPLVSGTTGLSDAQKSALPAASTRIPLAWASNFSLGVAVLHDLVERAARVLPGWDCDIVEAHHTRKLYCFESALTPNVFWVDLTKLDLTEGAPTRKLDLGDNDSNTFAGETSGHFQAAEPFTFLGVMAG